MIAEQPAFGPEAEVETGEIEASVEVDAQLHAANRAAWRLARAAVELWDHGWRDPTNPDDPLRIMIDGHGHFFEAVKAFKEVGSR